LPPKGATKNWAPGGGGGGCRREGDNAERTAAAIAQSTGCSAQWKRTRTVLLLGA